jgi:hypothetical protein
MSWDNTVAKVSTTYNNELLDIEKLTTEVRNVLMADPNNT